MQDTLHAASRSGGQTSVLSRDPARSRPPTDRPLDVVGLELLLCVTQALLAGMLLTLTWDLGADARAVGLPVPGLLAILGIAVGACWAWWLVGGSGWPLAAVDVAVALLTGALWLLSLQDASAPRIDPLMGLIAVSCAVYGIVAGAFLPGPRRGHWKGGVSQPRRGLPDTRTTPARFSPPVQKVVDERLANVTLPHVTFATVRLSRRSTGTDAGDALVIAPTTQPAGPDAGGSEAVAPGAAAAPPLVHRIAPEAEPISVASMRLSMAASSTPDEEPGELDDDESEELDADPRDAHDDPGDDDAVDEDDETVAYADDADPTSDTTDEQPSGHDPG